MLKYEIISKDIEKAKHNFNLLETLTELIYSMRKISSDIARAFFTDQINVDELIELLAQLSNFSSETIKHYKLVRR